MASPQKILKTDSKSYPRYFPTYPRNGKTTVSIIFHWASKIAETAHWVTFEIHGAIHAGIKALCNKAQNSKSLQIHTIEH